MGTPACRSCAGRCGDLVLDLGNQPACDHFPGVEDPGPDPRYPLQMWLCSSCGLAQLLCEPTSAEEPLGTEPAALVAQAADAVECLAREGWLAGRSRVAEFPSPHGGSWLGLMADHGVASVADAGPADLVIDSFGMMHDPDQSSALAQRAARVSPEGALLLQYHSLDTIVRLGQWSALRHGHYAYYSTSALVGMLEAVGFSPAVAWRFDLYGGTVLLAATRGPSRAHPLGGSVEMLLSDDARLGVRDPAEVGRLQDHAEDHAQGLRDWLVAQRSAGRSVVGYGAASRAVAPLCRAGVDRRLLPAIVDTSRSKHGLRMPGTDVPIVSPEVLTAHTPDAVLLFVPDLLTEVRTAFPEVERSGGQWVDSEALRAAR
jgi:C-methyltransferase C-terminal domain/Putative zinc binding domain/Methyltransferase domain